MYGDFSNWTFDENTNSTALLAQQGQPLTDADWNEQAMICDARLRKLITAAFGLIFFENKGSIAIAADGFTFPELSIYADGLRLDVGKWFAKDSKTLKLFERPETIPSFEVAALTDGTDYALILEAIPELRKTRPQATDREHRSASWAHLTHSPLFSVVTDDRWKKLIERNVTLELRTIASHNANSLLRVEIANFETKDAKTQIDFLWSRDNAISVFTGNAKTSGDVTEVTIQDHFTTELRSGGRLKFVQLIDARGRTVVTQVKGVGAKSITIAPIDAKNLTFEELTVRFWDGLIELKEVDLQQATPLVVKDDYVSFSLSKYATKTDQPLEPILVHDLLKGDYWQVPISPQLLSTARHRQRHRSIAAVRVCKFKTTGGGTKIDTSMATLGQLLESLEGGLREEPHSSKAHERTARVTSESGTPPEFARDVSLRHMSSDIKTPELRRWLHSATLPEVFGHTATSLREQTLNSFSRLPADLNQFEADLGTVVSATAALASRLNYQGDPIA